jgi:SAM-dependent methyltransferase
MSETDKYKHLTQKYCRGNGLDIGSGGWPVVPWAIQADLPQDEFAVYNQRDRPDSIHLAIDFKYLPFKDNTLDFVYSSHLIEDFTLEQWRGFLPEWVRVLKPGGYLVILIPDKVLWNEAIAKGQTPNCAHKHEGQVGELSSLGLAVNVIEDRLTDCYSGDYSILFVGQKP